MTVQGVDYSTDRPSPTGLAAAGKKFACRYGGPGTSPKHLDPVEALALESAGVAIVANAEGAETGLLGGRAAGRDWASRAEVHFARCGMPTGPAGRPIYLSVDFDVTVAQWPAVADALRGAAEILGPARVGVYGGVRAVRWARRDNVARWFWQTYAWSGTPTVWATGNHIEQYNNHEPLAGGTVDLDRAIPADYGQWTPGGDMSVWDEDVIPAPADAQDYDTNKFWQAKNALANVLAIVRAMDRELDTVRADLAELKARPPVVAAPIDAAALRAVLLSPEVREALD